jgi:2-alkenal reductase
MTYARSGQAATHAISTNPARPLTTLAVAGAMLFSIGMGSSLVREAGAQETSTPPAGTEQEVRTGLSVADVAEQANDAVVTIYTFTNATTDGGFVPGGPGGRNEGMNPAPEGESGTDGQTPLGAGSGWIYTQDGYVITNAHVVSGADSFVVQYADGTQVEATLIGSDTLQDVAVLKLDLADGETVPGVAEVGDSALMRAGDEVVAIGSPLGEFTNSVSEGHIGGLDRSLDSGNGLDLGNLIQHDAEISSGNSGGPLLNMYGEVIGMNVAKIDTASLGGGGSASGLNFAIDGNTVVGIADEIIETGESIGYPYVGVQTQQTEYGLMVVEVDPAGPAAASGLAAGDILVGIGDVRADETTSFLELLMEHRPGDQVSLVVERNGQEQTLDVTLGTRPEA